jgi:uncharacterized membrane protein YeaQ/YmgE (transglycosylase-associated protein family)
MPKLDAVHILMIVLIGLSAGLTASAAQVPQGTSLYVYLGIAGSVLSAIILALKSSILPHVNLEWVKKNAARLGVRITSLTLILLVCSCALFTRIVSVISPASATILSCLNDYADADPPNVFTIAAATAACGASVEQVLPVILADLTPAADAGTLVPMSKSHPQRVTRLYAVYEDAIRQGYVCVSATACSPKTLVTVH